MSSPLSARGADPGVLRSKRQAGVPEIAGLLVLALILMLSGCARFASSPLPQSPGTPARAAVSGVPFYPQDEFQCGPAALAMALGWSGMALTPGDLSAEVYTPGRKGSLQSALITAARRHDRVAYPIRGSAALLTEVAAGHPVIVLVNLGLSWYPKWHYAVVIGYDQQQREIILHSGRIADERLANRVFKNIWRRSDYWGLLVLPPEQLPASAEELPWLEAVAGLEQAERWPAAATGYNVALKRWPQSFVAWMGLGNSRYRLQDLAGAAEAFSMAAKLQPKSGFAFNNLAHVLLRLGQRQEAIKAARRAVSLGGSAIDSFRQTLREVEAGASAGE